ncbi:MAG TPA: carboxypeptidase-like regulatory domain-containing protein, partial [Pedobacter sp.]
MYKSLLLFYILLALPLSMIAQTTKTILLGKVVNENGGFIQGASLVITHLPTGTIFGCATNLSGSFFIPNLEPGGPYQVEVTSKGFRTGG